MPTSSLSICHPEFAERLQEKLEEMATEAFQTAVALATRGPGNWVVMDGLRWGGFLYGWTCDFSIQTMLPYRSWEHVLNISALSVQKIFSKVNLSIDLLQITNQCSQTTRLHAPWGLFAPLLVEAAREGRGPSGGIGVVMRESMGILPAF